MSGGGGNAQSGETRYDWNPVIGGMWGDGTNGVLNWAQQEAMRPYQSYGNGASRVAGFNGDQYTAMQRMRDLAGSGGAQDTHAGRLQNQRTAEGAYLNANPFAGAVNQYSGSSPQFNQLLQSGLQDITNAYDQGTSAETTRLMNLSGNLGGGSHLKAVANNQAALAKQLGQYTAGMQNDQYNRSAGLEDARLARGSGAYEGERGRMLQGAQGGLQGQGLSTDLINQLMGMGTTQQQQDQRRMDDQYGQWSEAMNWNRNNIDWLSNIIGRAQGSTGVSSSQSGYGGGMNAGAGLLGAGLLGRAGGLF